MGLPIELGVAGQIRPVCLHVSLFLLMEGSRAHVTCGVYAAFAWSRKAITKHNNGFGDTHTHFYEGMRNYISRSERGIRLKNGGVGNIYSVGPRLNGGGHSARN